MASLIRLLYITKYTKQYIHSINYMQRSYISYMYIQIKTLTPILYLTILCSPCMIYTMAPAPCLTCCPNIPHYHTTPTYSYPPHDNLKLLQPRPSRLDTITHFPDNLTPYPYANTTPIHLNNISADNTPPPPYSSIRPVIIDQQTLFDLNNERIETEAQRRWDNMYRFRDHPFLGLILLTYDTYPRFTLAGIIITAGVIVWNYDKIIELFRKTKEKISRVFLIKKYLTIKNTR